MTGGLTLLAAIALGLIVWWIYEHTDIDAETPHELDR